MLLLQGMLGLFVSFMVLVVIGVPISSNREKDSWNAALVFLVAAVLLVLR